MDTTARFREGKVEVMGLALSTAEMASLLDAILSNQRLGVVITPNVHFFVLAARSGEVRACFNAADIAVCDSRVARLLARLGGERVSLVPGSDLVRELLRTDVRHLEIVVVGGECHYQPKLEALTRSSSVRQVDFPRRARFTDSEIAAECEKLARAPADVCILALGAPLQERVAQRLRSHHAEAFGTILCVGAAVDFVVGAKPRAPLLLQRMHLEWLFRAASEPRRLLGRYVIDGLWIWPIFLRWLLRKR